MTTSIPQQQQPFRTALVTGSSSGIGEAIVLQLATLGYRLVVTGRSKDEIKRVASKCATLSPRGEKPLEIVANLSNQQEADVLFAGAIEHFGQRLDLLVNNAGLGEPVEHTRIDECYQAFMRIMQTNLNSAVRLSLLAAPHLKKTAVETGQTSSIINISSIASFRPGQAGFGYSVSKAALNMLSDSLAAELGPLVRVNCVSPGPVETKIIARSGYSMELFKEASKNIAVLERTGQPEEVAQAVVFLADHKRAAFITGANLVIDGGTMVSPLRWNP